MAIGIEVNGGRNNKFTRGVINVEGEDSKGIVLNETEGNEFEDYAVFVGNSLQEFREMRTKISQIKDDSINDKTKNKFKEDVLAKLPNLSSSNEIKVSSNTLKEIISILSDWITIKGELSNILMPMVLLINTVI